MYTGSLSTDSSELLNSITKYMHDIYMDMDIYFEWNMQVHTIPYLEIRAPSSQTTY